MNSDTRLTDEQLEAWAKEADAPMSVSERHQYKTWTFGLEKLRRFAALVTQPATVKPKKHSVNKTFQIHKLLADQLALPVTSIGATTKLEDLGMDSLDMIEIVMGLEDIFGVDFADADDEEIARVCTVEDLYKLEKLKHIK